MLPYIALALQLIKSKGHRVRIATHAEFSELVTDASVRLAGLTDSRGEPLTGRLEHFDIGGAPAHIGEVMLRCEQAVPEQDPLTPRYRLNWQCIAARRE